MEVAQISFLNLINEIFCLTLFDAGICFQKLPESFGLESIFFM